MRTGIKGLATLGIVPLPSGSAATGAALIVSWCSAHMASDCAWSHGSSSSSRPALAYVSLGLHVLERCLGTTSKLDIWLLPDASLSARISTTCISDCQGHVSCCHVPRYVVRWCMCALLAGLIGGWKDSGACCGSRSRGHTACPSSRSYLPSMRQFDYQSICALCRQPKSHRRPGQHDSHCAMLKQPPCAGCLSSTLAWLHHHKEG